MARSYRRLAALAACAFAFASAAASAQGLRTLHVDALAMRADKRQVHVGETFHLAIHAHVRERVLALDELMAPDVGTMHLLGDERRLTQAANGTDVIETLTLEPTVPGAVTFQGAYLDAIDARTKKPSRFSSPPLRLVVLAAGVSDNVLARAAKTTLSVVLIILGLVTGIVVLFALARTRRARAGRPTVAPAPVVVPPPQQAAPRGPRDEVAEALRAYRAAPANGALTRLRASLFIAAGARPGSTLRDALAATQDQALRAALIAAERTAFGPAHGRDASSSDLVDAADAWLR